MRSAGREEALRARRGVVLCTGGFINDEEMLRLHAPLLARCKFRVGAEGDDGSGIRMGIAAGGAPLNLGMGSISLPVTPPKAMLKGLLVNGQGQRFVNEDAYMGRLGEFALLHHEGRAFWILDDATFVRPDVPRKLVAAGETPRGAGARARAARRRPAGDGRALQPPRRARARIRCSTSARSGWCPSSGRPSAPSTARSTARSTPPSPSAACARARTARCSARTATPIPGLYAAGRASACLAAPGYASGLSLGDGTFFGRRAGRKSAGL